MKYNKLTLLLFFISIPLAVTSQNLPFEVYLGIIHQNVYDKKVDQYTGFGVSYIKGISFNAFGSESNSSHKLDSGYGIAAEFRYLLNENIKISFDVGYENLLLFQDNVLQEWDWDYWNDRYIDFLPGITSEEANKTLRYRSSDGEFSAIFNPTQKMKELKFASSFSLSLPVMNELLFIPSLQIGASIFTRELEMREKWTRRYEIKTEEDTTSYFYNFELLHFAPDKNGTRFFIAPGIGVRFTLNENYDFEFDFKFIQYINRKYVKNIEDIFKIVDKSQKRFPLYSKYLLRCGIVFKY